MKLICGDSLTELKKLDSGTVQTCVTSPPYWGLRDYGVDGQLGLEKTPEEYVAKMVEIFREVRRVLRDDGTLWLNLGDSYSGSCQGWGMDPDKFSKKQKSNAGAAGQRFLTQGKPPTHMIPGLKPKDLVGIPWRVAFALQKDGWYLRSDIIWSKPNPMPSSVIDRPTMSHEYIFLLAKSGKALFWTHRDTGEGVRNHPEPDYRWIHRDTGEETAKPQTDMEKWRRINLWRGHDYHYDAEAIKEQSICQEDPRMGEGNIRYGGKRSGEKGTGQESFVTVNPTRNKRSIWEVTTQPLPEAHFATFPPKLIEPCVLAGSASKACAKCGAPWVMGYERTGHVNKREPAHAPKSGPTKTDSTGWAPLNQPTEYKPSCKCNADTKPSIVLDPFAGSGTTCLVAEQKGRDYIGIELNPEYIKIAKKRLKNLQPEMFT